MHVGVLCTSYPRYPGDPAGNFVLGLNRYLRGRGCAVTVLAAGERGGGGGDDGSGVGGGGGVDDAGFTVGPLGERVLRLRSSLFYGGGAPERLFGAASLGAGLRAGVEAARFSTALVLAARRLAGCDALVSHFVVPCGVAAALVAGGRPHLCIAHSSDVHLLRRLGLERLLWPLGRAADLVYSDESLRPPGAPGRVQPMGIDVAALVPGAWSGGPRGHGGDGAAGEGSGAGDDRSGEGRVSVGGRGDDAEADRDEAAAVAAARAALGLRGPTALFLGRLVPVKGVDVLLAALERAPGLDLLIAGDGPERLRLAALAARLPGRVRLLGEVGPAQRARLLLACDLVVLPSLRLPDGRTEGAPTVLLEALAAGRPVVASAVGGAGALLGAAGRLVPPGDVAALAAALNAALDPAWQAAARASAAERAAQGDWSVVGPRLCARLLSEPFAAREGPRVAATDHPG